MKIVVVTEDIFKGIRTTYIGPFTSNEEADAYAASYDDESLVDAKVVELAQP